MADLSNVDQLVNCICKVLKQSRGGKRQTKGCLGSSKANVANSSSWKKINRKPNVMIVSGKL